MSLVAFAARVCLVRAIRGATYAGDDVRDAPVDPIALAVGATAPSIAVFTDTESTLVDGGRSLLSGDRSMDVISHVFLPPSLKVTVDGAEFSFAGRRAGAALVIDLIFRSMECALMTSDGVWASLWRRFVPRVKQVDHRAYVLQEDKSGGVRIPAREIVMRCSTVGEPPFGAEPTGLWADFVAALETSPDTVPLAPLIRSAITGPTLAPRWLVERWYMGEGQDEADGLGYAPLDGDPAFGPPVALAPATVAEVTFLRGPDRLVVGQGYQAVYGPSSGLDR